VNILSIETSCDETAIALVGGVNQPEVLVNLVSSQIDLHRRTDGIVPEIAAREQLTAIVPMITEFKQSLSAQHLKVDDIEAIAVTKGPGLIGSLLVGVEAAQTLGELWHKPVYGIHHIEGHIYAALADWPPNEVSFPLLALVVSGGHSQLVVMKSHFNYQIVGSTRDDAAGEAFDKTARLLGLSYPGGPAIAQVAQEADDYNVPELEKPLPRPMLHDSSLDFSFSGLKTALYYELQRLDTKLSKEQVQQYAREVQNAIVETLIVKTMKAVEQYGVQTVVLVGGVSANKILRQQLTAQERPGLTVIVPKFAYTTDNAAMIGVALWHRLQAQRPPVKHFVAKPRLNLELESS